MVRNTVAFLGEEISYLSQLADYAKKHQEYGIECMIFTKEAALMEYLESKKIALIMVSQNIYGNLQEEAINGFCNFSPVGILSEERISEDDGIFYLFRYQALGELMRSIRDYLARNFCPEPEHKSWIGNNGNFGKTSGVYGQEYLPVPFDGTEHMEDNLKIICVFSASGGCMKTTMARRLARREADIKKTFLLSLELFPEKTEDEMWQPGFSELIYYLHEQDKNLSEHFQEMIHYENGYGTILAGDNAMDYLYLTVEDLKNILSLISCDGGFSTLVVDVGFMNDAVIYLMERANEILYFNRGDEISIRKKICWGECMKHMGKGNVLEKLVDAQ